MEQVTYRTVSQTITLGRKIRNAAAEHGAALQLVRSTAERISADLDPAIAATEAYDRTVRDLKTRRETLKLLLANNRDYLALVRQWIKPKLGKRYSVTWNSVGFTGSLALPRTFESTVTALGKLKVFLADNPTFGSAEGEINAKGAEDRRLALEKAAGDAEQEEGKLSTLKSDRDAKVKVMQKCIRSVVSELEAVLDPLDGHWITFGLNRPGAAQLPEVPDRISAVLIGNNAVSVKWTPAARASHYRVWKKVVGVDTEAVPVGSPSDLDFIIENLPSDKSIEISVSAVNNGGESAVSKAVVVKTAPAVAV